jgi:hypothetical protein
VPLVLSLVRSTLIALVINMRQQSTIRGGWVGGWVGGGTRVCTLHSIQCDGDVMCVHRKKPKDGSNTFIANTLMEGIRRTWVMMREQESSYTAVRGGMEDLQRDELDGAVRKFVSDCSERIDELKLRMTADDQSRNSVDERAHLKVQTQVTHPHLHIPISLSPAA